MGGLPRLPSTIMELSGHSFSSWSLGSRSPSCLRYQRAAQENLRFFSLPFCLRKNSGLFFACPLVGLYQHYEDLCLNHLSHNQICNRLGLKPSPSIQEERSERIKIWSQLLKSHHQLHSKKRNLITILQPNIHLTGSKPISYEGVKMKEGYHYGLVDEFYPHAKTVVASLEKNQDCPCMTSRESTRHTLRPLTSTDVVTW